ncbi:MAG: TetR/AcrR family transcriptional regulator [Solirubrobacteraceae bacterium]|nr:TetR/AcrR family transcriptional regulator [Solirubrobacteraceae bacterium]
MTASPPRLTRKEQQARTRATLITSATRVLARKGLRGASIDDITADAGFTKGAFYANFASKEAMFLELLDEQFAEKLETIERIAGDGSDLGDQADRVGRDFVEALRGDEDWSRLFLEFAAHATREPAFGAEFRERFDKLRGGVAAVLERRAAELGIVPPFPADEIARMTFSMAHGVALEQLLDPATPEDLFGSMLRLFFGGVVVASTPAPPL